jgi:hypothetical protein
LRGEYIETFGSKDAGGALVRGWHRRRDGEMVSSVECGGLAYHPEIAVELFELPAHPVEAAQKRAVVDPLPIGFEKAIEGSRDDCRLGGV